MDAGNVEIRKSENAGEEKLRVEYSGDSSRKPQVTCSGGRLQIKEPGRFRWFNFDLSFFRRGYWERKLIIWVPEGLKDLDVQIDSDAGSVICSDIFMKNLTADVDAGQLEVEGCTVTGEASLEVDAGSADINNASIGFLKGDIDMGDINCRLTSGILAGYTMEKIRVVPISRPLLQIKAEVISRHGSNWKLTWEILRLRLLCSNNL